MFLFGLVFIITNAFIFNLSNDNFIHRFFKYNFGIGLYTQLTTSWLLFFRKINPEERDYLERNFPYYIHLTKRKKKEFLFRFSKFIQSKDFIPVNMLYVPDSVKYYISATATQIAFGLDSFVYPTFSRIYVHPKSIDNTGFIFPVEGLTSMGGYVHFSMEAIERGRSIADDGENVVVHETAHMLQMEDFGGDMEENDFLDEQLFRIWLKMAIKKREIIQHGLNELLPEHAAYDLSEMFAVSLENFFERPEVFQQKLPKKYKALCLLLGQNPLNKNNPLMDRRKFYYFAPRRRAT